MLRCSMKLIVEKILVLRVDICCGAANIRARGLIRAGTVATQGKFTVEKFNEFDPGTPETLHPPQIQRERELAAAWHIDGRGWHGHLARRMTHGQEARHAAALCLIGIDWQRLVAQTARV